MRTFSCVTSEWGSETPTLSFIIAQDERRACELARREILTSRRPTALQILEGGKLLWEEAATEG